LAGVSAQIPELESQFARLESALIQEFKPSEPMGNVA
jgi:hypothetical protein